MCDILEVDATINDSVERVYDSLFENVSLPPVSFVSSPDEASKCSFNAEAAVLRQLKISFLALRCQYTDHWVPAISTSRRAILSDDLDSLQTLVRQFQLFQKANLVVPGLDGFPDVVPTMMKKLHDKILPFLDVVERSIFVLANVCNVIAEESSTSSVCLDRRREAIGRDRCTVGDVTRPSVVTLVGMLERLHTLLGKDIAARRSHLERLHYSTEKCLEEFVNYWTTESDVDKYFKEILFWTQFFIE